MVIGPDYVYIALPRTASQSMAAWLCEHHGGAVDNDLYHSAAVPEEHSKKLAFTIVRDPYRRMASLYRVMVQKFWPEPDQQVAETVGMTMAQFVRWCIGRPETQWWPQAKILAAWQGPITMLCFENLPDGLTDLPQSHGAFPHIGATEPGPIEPEAIGAINEHSRLDFERLGFEMKEGNA